MVKVFITFFIIFGVVLKQSIDLLKRDFYSAGHSNYEVPITLRYNETSKNPVDCETQFCTWQYYNNSTQVPLILSHAPDYNLLPNEPPLSCKPEVLGYTAKQAAHIFPATQFPPCNKTASDGPIIYINTTTLTLHMSCQGFYYLGQPGETELIGRSKFAAASQKYSTPVHIREGVEWAFGSCTNPDKIEGATYTHYKNQSTIDRVTKLMYSSGKNTSKIIPTTVLFIILDSISRESFYRNLPLTASTMNSLRSHNFTTFDFKTHNVFGDNSIINQFPTWTGSLYTAPTPDKQAENNLSTDDRISSSAIWTYLRSKGWATLFSNEFCNDYFSRAIGRKPDVDHIMSEFWCAAKELVGFDDMSQDQRCIGDLKSHEYIFNYLVQYVKNYKSINKWAHVMSVTAHEGSGKVIRTLDKDLSRFLQEITEAEENLVLIIAADHGMRYKDWFKKEEGRQEHALPMLMITVGDKILNEIPYARDVLLHNSNRIVSKIDLWETQRFLAEFPYQRGGNWKYEKGKGVNLFKVKIPNTRTCDDEMIKPEFCACNEYVGLDVKSNRDIVKKISGEMLTQLNQNTLTVAGSYGEHFCKKFEAGEVTSLEWVRSDGYKEYFRVKFLILPEEKIEFSVFLSIFAGYMKRYSYEESFDFFPIYNERKEIFRILGISSNYSNELCEKIREIRPEISENCVCKELKEMQYHEPQVIEELRRGYLYILSEDGEDCNEVCGKNSMKCSKVGINAANTCKSAMEYSRCTKCIEIDNSITLAVDGDSCFINGSNSGGECEGKSVGIKRICACEKRD